ncbi:NTF2-related export protein 1 [Nephila pilipes]|uniref:NTF2-related export protein n=1 Tax=Nephila pilipes TaxID=299642 RepID=A0A8X6NJN5_NEPPI|nr:NTF2-related export protein 1 [Nephila pilipes]
MTDKRSKVDLSGQSGIDFSKLFYETMDKKRHLVSNLYLDTASLVWNGNPYAGKENISKFYETLPVSSTDIRSVDAQPIAEDFVQGQTSVLVSVSGIVKFSGKSSTLYSESFLLTAQQGATGNIWKIAADCFRFHETLS